MLSVLRSKLRAAPALIFGIFLIPFPALMASEPAEWIWSGGSRDAAEGISATYKFELAARPKSATLFAIGDFCSVGVGIRGLTVSGLYSPPYGEQIEVDVTRLVQRGGNTIKVNAQGVPGPSAFALKLVLVQEDGTTRTVGTGDHWSAITTSDLQPVAATTFGPVISLGWQPRANRPSIGAFDEYNQWKEALGAGNDKTAATFSQLPEGFEIELIRTAAEDEGSWVSMAFDPKGRIILAREKRGLLRAILAKDRKSVGGVEVINDSLLECRGLLFAHGSLYANANNSKAFHRLRDTDGDDQFDEITLLKETGGSVGHGRNDLALGPDGMIYAIHGDSVQIPPDSQIRLPPTAETFRREGHLVRTDADGKSWEIVAAGLRNPFGIDFNPDGEIFTYDADNESDIGLPFYRPTRVNHLVSGVDFGWRQGGKSWPVYAPDSLPTTVNIGHGSPTAVKFGTRSHFPRKYRDALFILDWAYGRIIAVDVIPRGASYACRAHTFLRGRPLNVTDLDFGPDGAMYFVTGGRKTRSALYRIRYTGPEEQPIARTAQEDARVTYSAKARKRRRSLERYHQPGAFPDAEEDVWKSLGDPDPWIRQAARTALEHQPVGHWNKRAFAESHPSRSIAALLALSRVGGNDALPNIVNHLAQLNFSALHIADQLELLRAYEICGRRKHSFGEKDIQRIIRQTGTSFPSVFPTLNRELARLRLAFGDPTALPRTFALLAKASSQPDQLYYLDVLSRSGGNPAWTREHTETFFRSLKTAQTFTGDRSLPGFIKGIRERALAAVSNDDRKALAHVIDWKTEADSIPDPKVPGREFVKNWTFPDLSEAIGGIGEDYPKSIARGKEVFVSALCSRCHQVGSTGTPAAPNLTAVAGRFSRSDILKSIIEPSSVVAEIYQNHVVTKKDGTVILGRVIHNNLRESTFTLAPNPFAPWETQTVSKDEIARHEISPASPMPAGLLNTFTLGEIRDLVTFLRSGGSP